MDTDLFSSFRSHLLDIASLGDDAWSDLQLILEPHEYEAGEFNGNEYADIVALPSSDWRGIDPIHTKMAA